MYDINGRAINFRYRGKTYLANSTKVSQAIKQYKVYN